METLVADLIDMEADKQEFFNSLLTEDSSFYEEDDYNVVDFDDYSV